MNGSNFHVCAKGRAAKEGIRVALAQLQGRRHVYPLVALVSRFLTELQMLVQAVYAKCQAIFEYLAIDMDFLTVGTMLTITETHTGPVIELRLAQGCVDDSTTAADTG